MSPEPGVAPPRRRHYRPVVLLAAVAAAALLIALVAVVRPAAPAGQAAAAVEVVEAGGRPTPTLPPVPRMKPPSTPEQLAALSRRWAAAAPTRLEPGVPAREPLRALARRLGGRAGDATAGRYDHIGLRQWAADSALHRDRPAHTSILTVEELRWRDRVDGSGRTITVRYPAGEGPAHTDQSVAAGGLPGAVTGPLPTQPALLAAALNTHHPFSNGPQEVLRAIADLYQWHLPDRAVRVAAIAVLRDTDALVWHGPTTDRAGRPGVEVSATTGEGVTRDVLVLDPHTGEVLAYEMTYLRDPGRLGGRYPMVQDYLLILDHPHRTDHTTTA